jgi:hypothetical protein
VPADGVLLQNSFTTNHKEMMIGKKRLWLACLLFFVVTTGDAYAFDGWTIFQENEVFSISYQQVHCDDHGNGVAFDFFAIRLENKSSQKLNLQWFNSPEGESARSEQYISLILAPGEVMQGDCNSYANNPLMVWSKANSTKPPFTDFKFYLL